MRSAGAIVLLVCCWAGVVSPALAQRSPNETVNASTQVLREIMAVPDKGIPESLLREAQGIAIVPGMLKGGFIIGLQHGRGVLTTRDEAGLWRAPVFITLTAGSFGAQAGVQSTDLILVFKTRRGVDGVLKSKITFGADAAVAAGPVGRQASAATDAQLKAEILSYSRSRGLFAGVSVQGGTLHVDHRATSEYYAPYPGQPQPSIPSSGVALAQLVASLTPPPQPNPTAAPPLQVIPPPPPLPAPDECEAVRQQLVAAAQRLQPLLDPNWQQYLALPSEALTGQPLPPGASFEPSLRHYQTVASDPRYRALGENHDFLETYSLLRRYAELSQPRPGGTLRLPPPPGH
jgi:lipid-binding SYLF domain-containing protein